MNISVSNISWHNSNCEEFFSYCATNECNAVELAINKIWPEPTEVDKRQINSLTRNLMKFNLKMLGFHSLLYNRNDLNFFKGVDGFKKTNDYLLRLAELCNNMGGQFMVLGSPKNRMRGDLPLKEAWSAAIRGFEELAIKMVRHDYDILKKVDDL